MKKMSKNILSIFVLVMFISCAVSCFPGYSTYSSSSSDYSRNSSGGSSSSTSANADDCKYSYSRQQDGDWWRPVFTRAACSRSLKITYKVYFSDGSSDQSRFVYFLSSAYSKTERASQRYDKPGRIDIVNVEWGN
jgi:hypothetical protein